MMKYQHLRLTINSESSFSYSNFQRLKMKPKGFALEFSTVESYVTTYSLIDFQRLKMMLKGLTLGFSTVENDAQGLNIGIFNG